MRHAAIVAGLLLAATTASAQDWQVVSPDGRTEISVTRHSTGDLTWRVTRGGAVVLADAPLGLRRNDQAFAAGLTFVRATDPAFADQQYQTPHGKRRTHRVSARERTLTFANVAGAQLDVILHAQNDGVAFRYRFPETDSTPRTVIEEHTAFGVPPGSTGWMLPHQEVHKYGPAYEDFFQEVSAGTPAPRADGWSFPALFRTQSGPWLLITEAGLEGNYAGTHLAAQSPAGVYRISFPDPKEGLGVGAAHPESTLPWTMPWRVVIVGDAAARILESDLVADLSPSSRLPDAAWVRPGRASWSWWSESDSPKHAARLNAFTDLAADMAWEYALVDANWDRMQSGRIEDVLAHARKRGVGLLFWYNSGGPHNDVTEAPRDRMHTREARRAEFAKLKEWGVKGVKVDFWHSDKQDRIRQYREILEDAADFQLLVNFHGSTIPRGWSREFPHLIGMESVFGAEQYKFREAFTTKAAWHNAVLPFTRNVVGPMDYTPVTFSDVKYPRTTTNAHELALSVVFESGVQHYADSVQSYSALPTSAKQFLRQAPTAWDETRALAGEPGRSVIVARRDKETWYVGGLNGRDAAETVRVALNFLGFGNWTASIIRDGQQDRTLESATQRVTASSVVDVPMRGRGGFVMRLQRTAPSSITGVIEVRSPSGQVRFTLGVRDGQLTYATSLKGRTAIEPSPLGVIVDGVRLGEGVTLGQPERTKGDETYPWRGMHAVAVNRFNGLRVPVHHAGAKINYTLEVRAFDDGVGYRFVVPGTDGQTRVPDASSGFQLPRGSIVWLHDLYRGHYEDVHARKTVEDVTGGEWAAPPMTVRLPQGAGYAAITEAGLSGYAGMALQADGQRGFNVRLGHAVPASYPFALRYKDDVEPYAKPAGITGTITTPWRVVMLGSDLNTLVNSDILHNLAAPADPRLFPDGMKTSWLKPGRAVWKYLDGGENTFDEMKNFSKLAGELGFEHNVVEGFWQRWTPAQLRELVEYSKQRGVGIWLWKHSRDLRTPQARAEFFKICRDAGVVGAKVDFFDHEAKDVIDRYEAVLREAAESGVMVNFHGANKPTGESRTWPNEMTREGIFGLEYRRAETRAAHEATVPFTRFLAGHADYTPVIFGERKKDTTWTHQIATAVVFTSPVMIYGAHPASLLANPAVDVIKSIPSVWDETIVLPMSEIGEVAAFARRSGERWFLGIVNGPAPRTVKVPLGFLGTGAYRAALVRDKAGEADAVVMEEGQFSKEDSLTIELSPGGGFVGRFTVAKPSMN
jgi:alpha-glucosidase